MSKRLVSVCFAVASATAMPSMSASIADAASDRLQPATTFPDDQEARASADEPLVTYSDHFIIPHGKCQYFRQKAVETADPRWWDRYKLCESG